MIGKMLVFMREKRGMNQHRMAEHIMIPNNTLSQYENERRTVSYYTVDLIANECDFDIVFYDKKENRFYKIEDVQEEREFIKN